MLLLNFIYFWFYKFALQYLWIRLVRFLWIFILYLGLFAFYLAELSVAQTSHNVKYLDDNKEWMLKDTEESHCDLTEGSNSVFSWRYWEKPRKEWIRVFCYFEVVHLVGIFKEEPCSLCFYRNWKRHVPKKFRKVTSPANLLSDVLSMKCPNKQICWIWDISKNGQITAESVDFSYTWRNICPT